MRRAWTFGALAVALAAAVNARPALAVELFGTTLFGGSPAVPAGALAYRVTLNVEGEDHESLKALIHGVSRLIVEQPRGASDSYALVARARGDVAQLEAALYSEGHYAGNIDIRVDGKSLDGLDPAELSSSNQAPEIVIGVTSGPRFVFGDVVVNARSHRDAAPTLTPQDLGLTAGAPAKSSLIIDANEKLLEAWRSAGFPLARIADKDISADHARNVVDVRIDIDPGPPAVYGWVGVSGAPTLDHETILDQSKLTSGSIFRPADLKRARDRLTKLPGVESVRVVEGNAVDDSGGLPVNLEVVERKPRYFGATASVSTTDGAEVEAHWGHRNLFGEGEHLRIEGGVSRIGSEDLSQLEFDAAATFTKPGVLDPDTNLVSEFKLAREHPDAYESLDASMKVGLARVFNPRLSGAASLAAQFSRVDDAFGEKDFLLLSVPLEAAYDTRDARMDATRGVSVIAQVSPTVETVGGAAFVASEFQASVYRALDSDGRAVVAGRVGLGSIAGASLADVPASTRFFAGGGGSVRGYEYRSLGPMLGGDVIGGLGYVSASAEVRLKLTETFGIVPFVDVASVTDHAWPSFAGDYFIGAGIGLRYYTALGPLRIDVATPLTERDGRSAVAVYVGLGQAF